MSSDDPQELWLTRLLALGRSLVSELDTDAVLDRVLETARELTGARYAAIGVLNEERTGLSRFLTSGVDQQTHRAIGDLPTGRGVLGVLIEHPEPLRLADVGSHPRSYGFPAAHPQMRSFLGTPIVIRGEAWGNLYLAEKENSSEFSEQDEHAAVILAGWAAVAINNARLYEASEHRRQEAEKAVRSLEVTRDVAVTIGSEIALEHVLELIAKRGRALVGAKSLVIMLRDGGDLVVYASAGHVQDQRGARLPIAGSTSGQVLERGCSERIADVDARLRIAPSEFGVAYAHTALLVPMLYRGQASGLLAAFDRGSDRETFSEDDEQLLRSFAASAATAVALAQSVLSDRLRSALAAAEAERKRWARELHDETLQGLAGLRVLLSAALRGDDLPQAHAVMRDAVQRIDVEVENLRSIITDLRPAALDELGLRVAIETLLDHHQEQSGLTIEHYFAIPSRETEDGRLDGDIETAIYRIVQEALTNVVKHANAEKARLTMREHDGELLIEVQDDGDGFDTTAVDHGFGLTGIKERVSLIGGELSIDSDGGGTLLTVRLPVQRAGKRGASAQAELESSGLAS